MGQHKSATDAISRTLQVHLEQVVAMEVDFALLTRVWCVAELAEADKLHLHQSVKTHSASSREKCVDKLLQLDVREAQASFPADKDLVLSKIEDVTWLPTPI